MTPNTPHRLNALTTWIEKERWPALPCPICKVGTVHFTDGNPRTFYDSEDFHQALMEGYIEPDEISGRFVGQASCGNRECRASLAISGKWRMEDNSDCYERSFKDMLLMEYASPPFQIITAPEKTPEQVAKTLEMASSLVWISPSAAANQLRQAVEELLTAFRIPKTHFSAKQNKKIRSNTHERLGQLRPKHPEATELLEAVKWIGNHGSHESFLTSEDVLAGSELMEHALRMLYDSTNARLAARAKEVNKKRGIPKPRSKR